MTTAKYHDVFAGTVHYNHLDPPVTGGGGGSGTVTSVGLNMPSQFSVANSPVTTTGTFGVTWNNESGNTVFAGAAGGGFAAPTFRALVNADLPASGVVAGGYGNGSTVAAFDVDSKGIITNVVPSAIDPITVSAASGELTGGGVLSPGDSTTLGLADVVSPASATLASVTVDSKGRVTALSPGSIDPITVATTPGQLTGGASLNPGDSTTLGLADIVSPATVSLATVTFDSTGRITAASDGSVAPITINTAAGELTGGAVLNPGDSTTLGLADVVVGASYTNANITFNNKGQITAASSGTPGAANQIISTDTLNFLTTETGAGNPHLSNAPIQVSQNGLIGDTTYTSIQKDRLYTQNSTRFWTTVKDQTVMRVSGVDRVKISSDIPTNGASLDMVDTSNNRTYVGTDQQFIMNAGGDYTALHPTQIIMNSGAANKIVLDSGSSFVQVTNGTNEIATTTPSQYLVQYTPGNQYYSAAIANSSGSLIAVNTSLGSQPYGGGISYDTTNGGVAFSNRLRLNNGYSAGQVLFGTVVGEAGNKELEFFDIAGPDPFVVYSGSVSGVSNVASGSYQANEIGIGKAGFYNYNLINITASSNSGTLTFTMPLVGRGTTTDIAAALSSGYRVSVSLVNESANPSVLSVNFTEAFLTGVSHPYTITVTVSSSGVLPFSSPPVYNGNLSFQIFYVDNIKP